MIVNCANICKSCPLRDAKIRCNRDYLNMTSIPAKPTGGLTTMFENIIEKYSTIYNVTVLSRDPWVVTFDNFMTDTEIDALLSTASSNGQSWERSTDTGIVNAYSSSYSYICLCCILIYAYIHLIYVYTGSVNAFGETGRLLSKGRTSSNAWCRHECESHPDVK